MWDELVAAYEDKIDVLEEARGSYAQALADLMGEVSRQLDSAVSASAGLGSALTAGQSFRESDPEALFVEGYRHFVPLVDQSGTIQLRLGTWVASCFGGPANTLRLVLSLDSLPGSLPVREWAARGAERIPAEAPGVPFVAAEFPDVPTDGGALRVYTVDLEQRDAREIAAEVAAMAAPLSLSLGPLVDFLRDAAQPMIRAEQALLAYRSTLEARAAEVGVETLPSSGGLGEYQGGKYLQVGRYWLCTAPEAREVRVECYKVNEPLLLTLSERLGRTLGRRVQPGCVLFTEDELRAPETDLATSIAGAFDVWFEARAANLAAAGESVSDEAG